MFYRLARGLLRLFWKLYFRWEVYGKENLPSAGGVLLAANHVSYLDPPLMGCAVDRPVYFMAKKELFDIPVLGWIIRRLGAFPVERGAADRKAIRKALEMLQSGRVVGIFPEGTRGDGRTLLKAQPGTVLLAVKAGVPIVPMAITGVERVLPPGRWFPRPVKIRIFIGEPIYIPADETGTSREVLEEYSRLLMERIDQLRSFQTAAVLGKSAVNV
ncbi:MAG TPA: 1-acyl-sn-glycerol-3-phosphate acyltransferase [Firmicutes bacterium]|nr:1-acyl-sn-glycerol-3-phosphate acyltransferase [Bacillota bacterium]